MEDEIIKGLYQKYLNEIFEIDQFSKDELSYFVRTERVRYVYSKNGRQELFTDVGAENDGYILVERTYGKNFIDSEGSFLFDEWLDDAKDFSNGYALITKDGKSNFVDTNGNLVSSKWLPLDKFSSYFNPNGCATLEFKDRKTAIMDKYGRMKFYGRFMYIGQFYGETAIAVNYNNSKLRKINDMNYKEFHIITSSGYDTNLGYKYSDLKQVAENIFLATDDKKSYFIDSDGRRIGDIEFTSCPYYGFRNGYLIITNNGKSNIVSEDCKLVYKNWYDSVDIPYEGFSIIKRNGKYNYIDKDENILSDIWFDYARPFGEDTAVVKRDGKDYLIDKKGNISKESYDSIESARNGYRIVERDGRFNIIAKEGTPLSEKWFDYAFYYTQENDLVLVQEDDKKNYIDVHGTPLLEEGKDYLTLISDGYFGSLEDNSLVVYDLNGNVIDKIPDIPSLADISMSFRVKYMKEKVKKPKYTKKMFHYEYEDGNNRYSLNGIPLVDYGDILILDVNGIAYSYIKDSKKEECLGPLNKIKIDSNYIIIDDKKYFVSGKNLIDVTNIDFKRKIDLKSGIESIKSYEEFRQLCHSKEYQEIINAELEKARLKVKEERDKKITEELRKKQEEERKLLSEKQENLRKSLSNLSEILTECSKYLLEIQGKINDNQNEKVKVPDELLLISVDDHYEFNPIFLTPGILRFVDLSNISLADVKVSGLDLSYTNAHINPQNVYNKDMSNGKYCGLDFNLCDFAEVNTTNSDFTDSVLDFAINKDNIGKQSSSK